MSLHSLIFLHIVKTGGSSLRQMLQGLYADDEQAFIYNRPPHLTLVDFRALPLDDRRRIKFVCGHFPFGVHEYLPNPSGYVTFVRHPIVRVVSMYYHHYTKPKESLYERIHNENLSLGDFVKARLDPNVENGMTRAISGRRASSDECTEEMLERAIDNIRRHFVLVGVTEHYEESLLKLKAALQLNLPDMVKTNVTEYRLPLYNVSDSDLDIIRQMNSLDLRLYQFAIDRLFENTRDLEIERQAKLITSLQHDLANRETAHADLSERLCIREEELEESRKHTQALMNSTSWRITAPLRVAKRGILWLSRRNDQAAEGSH